MTLRHLTPPTVVWVFFFPKGVRVPLITWGGAALMRHGGLTLTKSLSIWKGRGGQQLLRGNNVVGTSDVLCLQLIPSTALSAQ